MHNILTGKIIGRRLRYTATWGLLESARETCLAYELEQDRLRVARQQAQPVHLTQCQNLRDTLLII